MHEAFREQSFGAPQPRVARLHRIVTELVDLLPEPRVLDLGCGTGSQLLKLAGALPCARVTGVDTSPANIEAARCGARVAGLEQRCDFLCSDYLEHESAPFHVMLADSVLQNIPAAEHALFAKIARDLLPGGYLVATMPYQCTYNRVLWAMRQSLRPLRGEAMERVFMWLGRCLHPDWDPVLLAQRLPYLYMLPAHVYGPELRLRLQREHGLSTDRDEAWPHASLAQPKHRLLVIQRKPAP